MKSQLFFLIFLCCFILGKCYTKVCDEYLGCAFETLTCNDETSCEFICSGSNGCRASVIECGNSTSCNVYCTGSQSCTDALIKCEESTDCNVVCHGTSACSTATVTSQSSGVTNITCESGRSSCQEIIVDCDGAADCQMNCLGLTNACYGGFLTCPSSPSGSCSVSCTDYEIQHCPSKQTCNPVCYNFQIDCSTSGSCNLECGGTDSSKFPPSCFGALLLCNDNKADCACTGFCGYSSSSSNFVTTAYSDASACSSYSDDGPALQQFAQNITGLLYDWSSICDPCAQYYNGSTVYYMSQWSGVECYYSSGGVLYLRLQGKGLSGTTYLPSLPSSIEMVNLRDNQLSGTIDLSSFSTSSFLTTLYLSSNEFTGSIKFTELQSGVIQTIDLHSNSFSGTVDFNGLPHVLQFLSLASNQLTGTVNLSVFAVNTSTLTVLNLASNQFSGEANIGHFVYLTQLDISENQFYNYINFSALDSSVELLYLQGNSFYGDDSAFQSFPSSVIDVNFGDNYFNASITTVLNALKSSSTIRSFQAYGNELHGTADLSGLPSSLQTLDISSNKITKISSWGDASRKNYSNLTYLSVCSNSISQKWDPTNIPNSIQTLEICYNNFSGSIDFSKLPINITDFDASYNTYLTGTVSFKNLPYQLASINILQTGVSKPVSFIGMGDSIPALWMEKQVVCDATIYCSGECSYARHRKYCVGLDDCNKTCNCQACDITTLTPTSSVPTYAPTKKPTKKPTRPPWEPTPFPTAPPPPTKAPTKKPTYYHYSHIKTYTTSSNGYNFVANNKYVLVGEVYNYSNLYWDISCASCFEWICEDCEYGALNLTSLTSGNFLSVSLQQTSETAPVLSTLTFYPTTSSTTYCTYASIVTAGYMNFSKTYNITFRATGFSEYNGDAFTYVKSIQLYVVPPPQNVSCYYTVPSNTSVYCFETEVRFKCRSNDIYDISGETSFFYTWILFSDSTTYTTVRSLGDSDVYDTTCIAYGTSTYGAVVMNLYGMTTCTKVSISSSHAPGTTSCPVVNCINPKGLSAVVNSLLTSNVSSLNNSLSTGGGQNLAEQIANTTATTIADQLTQTLLISTIINKLGASSTVDSEIKSLYEALKSLLGLYEESGFNSNTSALSSTEYTQLFQSVCALQHYRNASSEGETQAYTNGGYLYYMIQVISQLSLIHSTPGSYINFTDTKYHILDLKAIRFNRSNPDFHLSTVSISAGYLKQFPANILDCIIAKEYSNLYDKKYDTTNVFQSNYLILDVETALEYVNDTSDYLTASKYASSTVDSCNMILFEMEYNHSQFFDSLEAKQECRFPKCEYYDTTNHLFTDTGCYVYEKTATSYTCACNHMTYFAGGWETWCPKIETKAHYSFLVPSISNIAKYPAGAIATVIVLALLGLTVWLSKPMDDKPLLAIKHATIADFSKKRFAETKIGYERAILMQFTWSTLDKATELFKVNFLDDHILFGIWLRKPHSNISTHIRVGLLFMLITTLLCISAIYYSSPRDNHLGEIFSCFWISFLCCIPAMSIAVLFTYSIPVERIDEKLLQPIKSMHIMATSAPQNNNILDDNGQNNNINDNDDEDSVLGHNNLMNEVANVLGTSSNTGAFAGGEEPGRANEPGGRKLKKQRSEVQIQKEEMRRAELQQKQAKASLKRYELAEQTRQQLLRQKYIFPSAFKQAGWVILVMWLVVCIALLFLYGMRIEALYPLRNALNVVSQCTTSYGVDISLKTYLSYNATDQYLMYFDESTAYIAPTTGDRWKPQYLTNTERWLLSFTLMLILCLFIWNVAYIYFIQWYKVAFFDPMKLDEGFYFSNDDILWDPNENYHNTELKRKKSADLGDGDGVQPITMEPDGNPTGAITGAIEMIGRDSDSDNDDNGPRIHDVFHALVASDDVGDGIIQQTGDQTDNIQQNDAALPQDGYMNMGYQFGMMLPPQPMVQNSDMLTPGNNDNMDGLPPQPQINETPQGLPDQRHAVFHQMVALNEANDHDEIIQQLIQKQPYQQIQPQNQDLIQLPPQPQVDSNATPGSGYLPPQLPSQRQGGRIMSFGSSNNEEDENPGN